jgi:plastocyanin
VPSPPTARAGAPRRPARLSAGIPAGCNADAAFGARVLVSALITKQSAGVPFLTRARTSVLTALVLGGAALLPRTVATAPHTGRVSGRVVLTAAVQRPVTAAAYTSRRVDRPVAASGSELANVVVFVEGAPHAGPLPLTRARIAQQGESFSPRVVAITRGSIVDFPNGDPYFHDVFSLSRAASFDLGSYPRGSSRSWQFPREGIVKVYCHIHSHMSASILVFDHPFFAIPRPDGSFSLDDLPAGTYRVSAWHERIGENTQPVRIEAGRAAEVEFSLPVTTR